MRNIALKLMYNGTAYHGWQVQKNAVTVCGTLEKAIADICGGPVHLTGCGRTDAGVHAEHYIANFRTTSSIPCDRIPLAVNPRLPRDIVVVKATQVPDSFNAIGSCIKKEYTYLITCYQFIGTILPGLEKAVFLSLLPGNLHHKSLNEFLSEQLPCILLLQVHEPHPLHARSYGF